MIFPKENKILKAQQEREGSTIMEPKNIFRQSTQSFMMEEDKSQNLKWNSMWDPKIYFSKYKNC